jgi:hypothetical protein
MSDENFIARWSKRKSASKAGTAGPTADAVPVQAGTQSPAAAAAPAPAPAVPEEPPQLPLPPVESLTPESDFVPFMRADVDPALKRQAFKKLIEDPQFNVMDGLDVYIDDYSKPDPLPDGWLEKMNQVKYLGIFKEAEEGVEGEAQPQPAPTQEALADQPLAPPAWDASADTPGDEIPPTEVGKSALSRGGN